jgi:hypothetical protein
MITAALPTYNNAQIIWLQLESLCAQVDAPEWELIVCEEKSDNTLGADGLRAYLEKLKAANCVKVTYLKLSNWVPLGQKWAIIRDHMHADSVGFMLCASDNHSAPDRVRTAFEAMQNGAEWCQYNKGEFYNIVDHKAGTFKAGPGDPALFMTIARNRIQALNETRYPKKGVDSWLLRCTRAKITNLGTAKGIHTDGFNTISHRRRTLYANVDSFGMFTQADENKVFKRFPAAIQEKLLTLRK